jgi:UPF0755 protein
MTRFRFSERSFGRLPAQLVVIGAAGFVGIVFIYLSWAWLHEAPVVGDAQERLVIHVDRGSHFSGVMKDLHWLGWGRPSLVWRAYGRLKQPKVLAGEYRLNQPVSFSTFLDSLARGDEALHPITIVEGWTLAKLRAFLADNPRIASLSDEWTQAQLMQTLGCDGCFGEGWFLPETYLHSRGDTDLEILRRAHEAMKSALQEVWLNRQSSLPLEEPPELLVLASLVEKESALKSERPEIAGVFARRLSLGMRLQTDPTVIYGLGEAYSGTLSRKDLRSDHAWNTYTRQGLPPTPIALPSRQALEAAANPAEGNSLYFVAKGDGSHAFSATLDEHNEAVSRYIRGRRQ